MSRGLPHAASRLSRSDQENGSKAVTRFAVFSDIHGNLPALETCLADMEAQGIEHLHCCGDLVGYGANPNECCDMVMDRGIPTIMGNHDLMAIEMQNVESFNKIAREAITWTHNVLTDRNKERLAPLPYVREEGDFTFVHASPLDPERWRYILTRGEARVNFECFDNWICFVGHSHQPFVVEQVFDTADETDPGLDPPPAAAPRPETHAALRANGAEAQLYCPDPSEISLNRNHRYLINVGSVGQPRDRNPRTCYVTVDLEQMCLRFRRLNYPVAEAQQAILLAGLPPDLAHRLSIGW